MVGQRGSRYSFNNPHAPTRAFSYSILEATFSSRAHSSYRDIVTKQTICLTKLNTYLRLAQDTAPGHFPLHATVSSSKLRTGMVASISALAPEQFFSAPMDASGKILTFVLPTWHSASIFDVRCGGWAEGPKRRDEYSAGTKLRAARSVSPALGLVHEMKNVQLVASDGQQRFIHQKINDKIRQGIQAHAMFPSWADIDVSMCT